LEIREPRITRWWAKLHLNHTVSRERKRDWGSTHNWLYCACIWNAVLLHSLAALVTVEENFSSCYRAMRWIDADELMGFFPESYWIPF
ncbi:hypothetical protein BHE74_00020893, partial [Ensete ventricosum]